MDLIKVRRHYQITLPHDLRKNFRISEGDYMEVKNQADGILIRPVKVIRPEQEYFYTKEWQEDEDDADKDIAEGRLSGPFETAEELIKELES